VRQRVSNWLPAAAVPIANRPGLDRTAFDGNQPSCELRGRRGSVWYGRRASGGRADFVDRHRHRRLPRV